MNSYPRCKGRYGGCTLVGYYFNPDNRDRGKIAILDVVRDAGDPTHGLETDPEADPEISGSASGFPASISLDHIRISGVMDTAGKVFLYLQRTRDVYTRLTKPMRIDDPMINFVV